MAADGKRVTPYLSITGVEMGAMQLREQIQFRTGSIRDKRTIIPSPPPNVLVQEEAGMHVGISADLPLAARHAAAVMADTYRQWWNNDRFTAWGHFKRHYFAVAVGGGTTVQAQYESLVNEFHSEIDWIAHVRFFFLEDSSGEAPWESPQESLLQHLIVPLAHKLIKVRGVHALAKKLRLHPSTEVDTLINRMASTLIIPINMDEVKRALKQKNRPLALRHAHSEARRYQKDIQRKLGATMEFHYIISGIGKNGALGAFEPYARELRDKAPGVVVIKRGANALRVALNRGVLINAERISLIISGHLKLFALGRFEIEEATDFEQTVMETPLRMLRETYDIAENVFIFADEQSLHFEETQFKYTYQGNTLSNKAETRDGEESEGVHALLLHGFMGLFSFTNFLVRLPSAWRVSALHRGSHAKTLASENVFPHYAQVLRRAILNISRQGRPVPIAGHSIAGVIIDHLLLSLLENHDAPIAPYDKLRRGDQKLVDALRIGGIISLATWAPSDGLHTRENIKSVISHYRGKAALDYSGIERVYRRQNEALVTTTEASVEPKHNPTTFERFLENPIAEPLVSGFNIMMRSLLNKKTIQQKILNANSPYIMRLVGNRLLKTASFYGLFKEMGAALHDPIEYQRRHLKALDIILAYDIPYLSIVHEDDFLVSARRHLEEYNYLCGQRRKHNAMKGRDNEAVTTRYIKLKRRQAELPLDPLNPHLMIMATSSEGNEMAREITTAMTRFVNENVGRATLRGEIKALASVKKWTRESGSKPTRPNTRLA